MRKWTFSFLLVLVFGCIESKISTDDLKHLNGYWEIQAVTFPDGTNKEYRTGRAIDFIHLDDMTGFRKKVYPKLDGSFDTSNSSESFQLTETDEGFVFSYSTTSASWQEKLVQVDSISFSVMNEEGLKYSYKRFEPIDIVQ